MTQDKCTIQVNGVEMEARPGQMLIEVTDAAGMYVPRFCYHSKLSIAANCRMCLVEVENAPKPLPACATPVAPGMKVHTRSDKAIGAQKATMEFLLINHPLDCPICDQGGECELQDLAMGFGRDVSRYAERKRVVRDKDIGPLVSTDMTRCIHCTRCVRFTQEVAGFQELGTIGRGDRVEISPYIERSVNHELSGNIIDLCPVGALNSKPYRFSARAWEMSQHATIAPHDCVGSRMFAHVMEGRVKRVVPQPCEAINETWLSDRDRFSYEGVYSEDRLLQPMLREAGAWRAVGWDEALDLVSRRMADLAAQHGGASLGALVSPCATLEEGYLLNRLMAHLGSATIDHRLRRRDFRGQSADPLYPGLAMAIEDVERLDQVLVIGANLRHEVPLLAHRVRKAAVRGAGVHFLNPARYAYLFPVGEYLQGTPADFWLELAGLVRAAAGKKSLPAGVAALVKGGPAPGDQHRRLVSQMREGTNTAVLLGQVSLHHPRLAEIEMLACELARLTGSKLGYLPQGSNSTGLALAGVLPHRAVGGRVRAQAGHHAAQMIASPPRGLFLLNVEPERDCAGGENLASRRDQVDFIVAASPFTSPWLQQNADVLLPIGTSFETSGTFVNVEARWQSFAAVARPVGEARPAWKVLRVLANRLGVPDSTYNSSDAVRDELRQHLGPITADNLGSTRDALPAVEAAPLALAELDIPMYQVDGVVRRAESLQHTADGLCGAARESERRRA